MTFAALLLAAAPAAPPAHNPAARYQLAWTAALPWGTVASVADFPGQTADAKTAAGLAALAKKGGGVLYFPPGTYRFAAGIAIPTGVVLRGADPKEPDARKDGYDPPTRFEFPKYAATFTGDGTPSDTAFQGITLADPAAGSNCGVVNVAVNNGHIDLNEGPDHACGKNRIVFGCVLRNAAVADPAIPDKAIGQHPWQRFTARHHAAVTVRSAENVLVANNRLSKSGESNFPMPGYVLQDGKKKPVTADVEFDYDNRPGLYVNDFGIGGGGGSGPDGTPETHPWGFRTGTVIRDNFVYCTGRCAIAFCGDGVACANNVIRFPKGHWRPTATGKQATGGASTNDNRAVQMRGWRWAVEGNDYEVHRNLAFDKKYLINDGEGLMHEDHVNSTVRDSKLVGNKGNSYLSVYKTGGVNGLLVQGNDIRVPPGIAAIYVVADRNKSRHECRNVVIEGNTTAGSGIEISGDPAGGNVVRGNTHVGPGGWVKNAAAAAVENNTGYEAKK